MKPSTNGAGLGILTVSSVGVLVAALDQTVVVTALPEIVRDIKIPLTRLDDAAWIVTAYLLGYTVALPLMGRLADIYGYRTMYQLALILFALGSLLTALSKAFGLVIAARTVQAIGGGATVPIALAMAGQALQDKRRALAIGLVAAAAETGSVLGPLYGGALIHWLGWRWIFWRNLPLSGVLIAALFVSPIKALPGARMDYVGGLLLTSVLTLFSLGLAQKSTFAFSSPAPYTVLVVGVFLAFLFVLLEHKLRTPLLTPAMFRSKPFLAANATQALAGGGALVVAMVTVPLMTDTVMGKPPLEGGLRLLRLTAAIPAGALASGALSAVFKPRVLAVLGLSLVAVSLYLMSGWD
jgi:MFS family permease